MSLTPISISQLPVAPLPVLQTDLVILSRGVNEDYQTTMNAIWQINMSIFPPLPSPSATDLMMVYHNSSVYSLQFQQVGFVTGTVMWFYMPSPPPGWALVAIANDSILGVVDSTSSGQYLVGGTQIDNSTANPSGTGTWKMTSAQLPPHDHFLALWNKNGSGDVPQQGIVAQATMRVGQTKGVVTGTADWGDWRPVTSVGILCSKL